MNGLGTANRSDLIARVQRLVGVNKWLLNLQNNVMRLEFGRDFNATQIHEFNIEELRQKLDPGEAELYVNHWGEALSNGHSGPVILPFLKADGSTAPVESACCLSTMGEERYLVGVFKRLPAPQKLAQNARVLSGFLETFIEHSPSSIVVTDKAGSIVSLNREFLRFIGGVQKSDYLSKSVLDPLYAINTGLGTLMRRVLHSPRPERGSFEVVQGGARQTLYWRSFPLSMDAMVAPPKVFAFDTHQQGPRVLA
ncbi:PAS fold-4 [Rhabdaerophilaceae bacterium]